MTDLALAQLLTELITTIKMLSGYPMPTTFPEVHQLPRLVRPGVRGLQDPEPVPAVGRVDQQLLHGRVCAQLPARDGEREARWDIAAGTGTFRPRQDRPRSHAVDRHSTEWASWSLRAFVVSVCAPLLGAPGSRRARFSTLWATQLAVPPTVSPSMRSVGWPTPTGTLCPSLPQVPTPGSSAMSLPIMLTRVSASGPLPMSVAPFTG
jgi:hypothetical protein